MAKTAKLGLNLTEDENTTFEEWRKSIDGNNEDAEKSNTQLIDDAMPLIMNMVPEFNLPYSQIEADYNNKNYDNRGDEIVYKVWYDVFNRQPKVGDLFIATGKSNDGYVFGFKGRVLTETNTVYFAFDDLVLYHDGSISSGSGGTKLYCHSFELKRMDASTYYRFSVITTNQEPYSSIDDIRYRGDNIIAFFKGTITDPVKENVSYLTDGTDDGVNFYWHMIIDGIPCQFYFNIFKFVNTIEL